MRTKTVKVLKFDELSDAAKQTAKDSYAELFGYSWQDEALDSIKALAKHFGGKMEDWSIDFFASSYSSAKFDMQELEPEEIREKLEKLGSFNHETLKGLGDCVLTGYCADESAIDGFRKAFHEGETNLAKLMDAAFDAWLKDAQSDCAAFYEDENFSEHSEANDYEYYADGRVCRHD